MSTDEEKLLTLAFISEAWPPASPQVLYDWGRTQLADLGKTPSLRAVLAVYEYNGLRATETEFDTKARRASEAWILDPTEQNRLIAARLASVELENHSDARTNARTIANMVARSHVWRLAVGVCLTGPPYRLDEDKFRGIRDAIRIELLEWASDRSDPVLDRHTNNETVSRG